MVLGNVMLLRYGTVTHTQIVFHYITAYMWSSRKKRRQC